MEPLFECIEPHFSEYAEKIFRFKLFSHPRAKAAMIISAVFVVLALIASVVTAVLGSFGPLIVLTVCLLFLGGYWFFGYKRAVKLYKSRLTELSGGSEPEVRVTFTDDRMTLTSGEPEPGTTVPFSAIRRAYDDKDMIFIETDSKLLYSLTKSSFVKGTPEELMTFLEEKGVKVRPKKK